MVLLLQNPANNSGTKGVETPWKTGNLLLNFMFYALLRYERSDFYGETTRDANREYCGNQTTSSPDTTFNTTVAGLLGDLQVATPRIDGFFAASKREVAGSNVSVYGIAQCAQTIDSAGCQACMEVAYKNIQRCPPNADGRALDSGCFMRYSDKPFFADNQTIDLLPFLKTSEISSLPTPSLHLFSCLFHEVFEPIKLCFL